MYVPKWHYSKITLAESDNQKQKNVNLECTLEMFTYIHLSKVKQEVNSMYVSMHVETGIEKKKLCTC